MHGGRTFRFDLGIFAKLLPNRRGASVLPRIVKERMTEHDDDYRPDEGSGSEDRGPPGSVCCILFVGTCSVAVVLSTDPQ